MISLLYFCNRNIYTEKMIKIWHCLFEEFLLRNMGNNFDGNEMKEILHKIIKEIVKENVPEIKKKFIFNSILNKKNENNYFLDNLKKVDSYNKMYDIICTDEFFLAKYHWSENYAKIKLSEKINENFKKIYDEDISKDTQKKVYDVIFNDSDFLKSFTFKGRDVYEFENKIYEEYKTKINDVNVSEILNYLSKNKNKEITKEFIYFLYESQNETKFYYYHFFFFRKK